MQVKNIYPNNTTEEDISYLAYVISNILTKINEELKTEAIKDILLS